jgi:hypothetical protein
MQAWTNVLPTETLAHIQSAGCKAQKKSVIGAHNRCWKYLIGDISTHGEVTRNLEFLSGDKDKQQEKLWTETKIGDILPWDEIVDEAEGLIESDQVFRRALEDDRAAKKQEDDQEEERDDTDTYMETIFGRRRPDSIAVEWSNKVIYILEFKRTSDQRQDYRECGENPGAGSTRHPCQEPRKGSKRNSWREQWMENQTCSICGRHVWVSTCADVQQ